MRRLAAIITAGSLAAATVGCSSVQRFGENTGKTGTMVLATSGMCPPLIPVGIVLALPLWAIGAAAYYGAGGREKGAFEL